MADENGMMLITAAATGDIDAAKELLGKGVDLHVDDDMPLRAAALLGNNDMILFLVDRGANVKASGSEALLYAAQRQDEAMVTLFLEKGASVDDMKRAHAHQIDKECLEALDRHESRRLHEAFEKNFGKLQKPAPHLRIPKNPKPPTP